MPEYENVMIISCSGMDDNFKCKLIPIFGKLGTKRPTVCKKHIPKDLPEDEKYVDLVHYFCQEDKCEIRAGFGAAGTTNLENCRAHKKEGQVDNYHAKCIHDARTDLCKDCGTGSELCIKCRDFVIHPRNRIYFESKCVDCFKEDNPDKVGLVRFNMIKEKAVSKYIKEEFKDLNWRINDTMTCANGEKYRPDILLIDMEFVMVIEVDENQHKRYGKEREQKRMECISEFVKRPVVFIRFNPDSYRDRNGKFHRSCWSISKEFPEPMTNEQKILDWNDRLSVLRDTIKSHLTNNNGDVIKHLFYDENGVDNIADIIINDLTDENADKVPEIVLGNDQN
jgi:hypothetical protein